MFDEASSNNRRDNITDATLDFFQNSFGNETSKDDIFFYIYGLLHSADFRMRFSVDLKKQAPRIPSVKTANDFLSFSKSGRALADLHLNYESVEPWAELEIRYSDSWSSDRSGAYRVEKMRYTKDGKETDLTTVIYNSDITIAGIPESAHDYRLGSRSAIDWIIDRYQIKTHKESGIVNDPNDWADEHDDPTYIFDLLRRIVTVSMKTNEIVAGLPKLEF